MLKTVKQIKKKNSSHTGNIEHDKTNYETTNALKKRADLFPRRVSTQLYELITMVNQNR